METMDQNGASPRATTLADQLGAIEVALLPPDETLCAPFLTLEKLRHPLTRLTGTAGYNSLLSRALTLAKRESSALAEARVNPDGSMEGLAAKAGPLLIAHLIGLLITFIGETLTVRLLQDIWPDFSGAETFTGRVQDEP